MMISRPAGVSVLTLLLLLTASAALGQAPLSDWPVYRHDPAHSGYSVLPGDFAAGPRVLWSADGVNTRTSAVVGDLDRDGRPEVVAVADELGLHLRNGEDGSVVWQNHDGPYSTGSPAVWDLDGNGTLEVLIGDQDGVMHAVRGDNGQEIWTFATRDWIHGSPNVGDLDGDGKPEVAFGSYDGAFYVVNGEDGSLAWRHQGDTNGSISCTPAIGDLDGDGALDVVVPNWDGHVYAFRGDGGGVAPGDEAIPLWTYTGSPMQASPSIGDVDGDGYPEVVVGITENTDPYRFYIDVLDGSSGERVRRVEAENSTFASPALGFLNGDEVLDVVFASAASDGGVWHGTVWGLDISQDPGEVIWRFTTPDRVSSSPALADIDGDGAVDVVIGCYDGNLYALRGTTDISAGDLLWSYPLGGMVWYNAPTLADLDGDGRLEILVTGGTTLYALDGENPGTPGGGETVWVTAGGETAVAGTLGASDYLATQTRDEAVETITEILSSDHPRKHYSYLEHRWTFTLPAGGSATFHATASRTDNSDGDDMIFEYSTDGSTWQALGTITTATLMDVSVPLGAISGTVTVRARDTDRTWGHEQLDALAVDYLAFEVTGVEPLPLLAAFEEPPRAARRR